MKTNLIWKRPDGSHDAVPADFSIVKVGSHSNLWVHKHDKDTFPFRIAGGWEEEEQSKRLNNMVNLLPEADPVWQRHLTSLYHHSLKDEPAKFIDDLLSWLDKLKQDVKGGNWEVEIVEEALETVRGRVEKIKSAFLAQA